MKRQWTPEELVEQFTLLPDEMVLLETRLGANQLGFAVWLKFFQYEARFPQNHQEIPKAVVSYIASQLDLSPRQGNCSYFQTLAGQGIEQVSINAWIF